MNRKFREFICTTAHPEGCREYVRRQIAYVRSQERKKGRKQEPKKVLVIGASTGYGLAKPDYSRVWLWGGNHRYYV